MKAPSDIFELGYGDRYGVLDVKSFYRDDAHPAREIVLRYFDQIDGALFIDEGGSGYVLITDIGVYEYYNYDY